MILDKTAHSSQICVNGKDRFTFNYAFAMDETQEMVYANAVQPLVQNLFRGLNVTILAYGQTGSGKTHTMGTNFNGDTSDDSGLIPRAISQIFEHIDRHSDAYTFEVTCSFVELYQEVLYDLLTTAPRDQSIVDIREDARGVFISNLTEVPSECAGDAIDCLVKGSGGRAVGATAMNATSSRSHAIYTVNVRTTSRQHADQSTNAKFHLVDLAGSERSNKTKATGQRFKEGVKINQGLLALGNVIAALGSAQRAGTHVSYRDSKLTRLLQDSLGGNSVTLMIACVSPADYNMDETLSTLRYADRAKQIRNKPIVNIDPRMAEIALLRQTIDRLRLELLYRDNPEAPPSRLMRTKLQSSQDGPDDDPASAANVDTFVVGSPRRPAFRRLSGIPSAEELSRLRSENIVLKQEHTQSRTQLERTLVHLSRLNLENFSLEQRAEQLAEGLQSIELLATELSAHLDAVEGGSSTLSTEARSMLATIRSTIELRTEAVSLEPTTLQSAVHHDDGDAVGTDAADEPLTLADATWSICHDEQMQYNDQLMELQQQIQLKMAVNARVLDNHRRLDEMGGFNVSTDHASRLADLEAELAEARRAADELKRTGGKSDRVTAKLAEDRRRRVQQLEAEVRDLQKQTDKQQRMLRQQEAYKQQVAKQELELQRMKKLRVDLIKKVKETTDRANAEKTNIKREHMKKEARMRKEATEMNAKKAKAERESVVMKRKVESYLAANKRLKEAMEKHRTAQAQRHKRGTTAADGTHTAHKESEIHALIDHEIEIIYSVVDAKHSLQQLMDDRSDMSRRLNELRRRERKSKLSADEQTLVAQLVEEVEMRHVQIADMQEKIRSSDMDEKIKIIAEGLHSMVDSRTAVRYLFGSLTDLRVEYDTKATRVQDMRTECEELEERQREQVARAQQQADELREECKKMRDAKQAVERSYEEKVSLLLCELGKRNMAVTSPSTADETIVVDVQQRVQEELLDSMRAKIEAYEAQVRQLEEELSTRCMLRKKTSLRASVKMEQTDVIEETEDEDDESWHTDDENRDPDWHQTPAAKLNRRPALRDRVR